MAMKMMNMRRMPTNMTTVKGYHCHQTNNLPREAKVMIEKLVKSTSSNNTDPVDKPDLQHHITKREWGIYITELPNKVSKDKVSCFFQRIAYIHFI